MSEISYLRIPVDSFRWAVCTDNGTIRVDTKLAPEVFWEEVGKLKKEERK